MDDPYDLRRFVEAQDPIYEAILDELKSGLKTSHWMWFVFPHAGHRAPMREVAAVDHARGAVVEAELALVLVRDDGDRAAALGRGDLQRHRAEPAGRAPHQHHVAWFDDIDLFCELGVARDRFALMGRPVFRAARVYVRLWPTLSRRPIDIGGVRAPAGLQRIFGNRVHVSISMAPAAHRIPDRPLRELQEHRDQGCRDDESNNSGNGRRHDRL